MLTRRLISLVAGLWLACVAVLGHAATVTYTPALSQGWNLVGNSTTSALDVKTLLDTQAANVTSVWKWNAATSKWAFYSPALDATAGALASYATTKGYDVLSSIDPGDGFWINVNATSGLTLGLQNGTGFALGASTLKPNWNLVATGDNITPAVFSKTVGNVTTLWAWNSANSGWYFYAPSAADNGTLANYISSKNYQDFGSTTLDGGRGFWVNYAGSGTGGTGGTGVGADSCVADMAFGTGTGTGTHAYVCFVNLTSTSTCDQTGLGSYMSTYTAPYTSQTNFGVSFAKQAACHVNSLDTVNMGGTGAGTGAAIKTATPTAPMMVQTTGILLTSIPKVLFDGAGNALAYWTRANGSVPYTFSQMAAIYNSASGTWEPEVSLSGPAAVYGAGSSNLEVQGSSGAAAVNSNGDAVVVWQVTASNGSNTKVRAAIYSATSKSWTVADVQPATMIANQYVAKVAFDGKGNVNVWMIDTLSKMLTVATAKPIINNWTTKTFDSTNGGTIAGNNLMAGEIAYDPSGNALAVWSEISGTYITAVNAARYDSVTKTWGAVTNLKTITSTTLSYPYAAKPRIAFDAAGNALAVWAVESADQTAFNVYAARYTASSKTWAATVALDSSGPGYTIAATYLKDTQFLKVRFDTAGDATAVWQVASKTINGQAVDLVTSRFSAASGTWGALSGTSLSSYGYGYGSYEIDADGNVFALGSNHANAAKGVQMARFNAATNNWYPVPANSISMGAQIAFDAVGNALLAWNGSYALYNVGNNSWSPVDWASIGVAGIATVMPSTPLGSLAMDANGSAIALWETNVNPGVLSQRLTAMTIKLTVGPGVPTLAAVPVGINATTVSASQIDLTWGQVKRAEGYDVYRGTSPNQALSAMTKLPTVTATSLHDTGLSAATLYYYKVVAVNAAGASAPSAEVVAATHAATGGTPFVGQMGGAILGTPVAMSPLQGVVSTLVTGLPAGSGSVTTDGTSLYFLDGYGGAYAGPGRVRKVDIATGAVSVLGNGQTFGYGGIATDGTNLYISEATKISMMNLATGAVSILAGSATGVTGTADGIGTAATFSSLSGITTDGTNVYVTDSNSNTIRKVVIATGAVSTLAGSPAYGSIDGLGASAKFSIPRGITTDGTYLYVADSGNPNPGYVANSKIRKILIATGQVTTLAGSANMGWADGVGSAASFFSPAAITTDGTNLFVSDSTNSRVRKVVIATGEVSTVAGGGSGDGIGRNAGFGYTGGITTDGKSVYVADGGGLIRKIVPGSIAGASAAPVGLAATAAGATQVNLSWSAVQGASGYHVYRGGSAIQATSAMTQLTTSAPVTAGTSYSDTGSGVATAYYKVTAIVGGVESAASLAASIMAAPPTVGATIAGSVAGGPACAITTSGTAKLCYAALPVPFTCDAAGMDSSSWILGYLGYSGKVYTPKTSCTANDGTAGTVFTTVASNAVVLTPYGTSISPQTPVNASGNAARFSFGATSSMTSDGANLYVADFGGVRKIEVATGAVTTIAASITGGGITTDGTYLYLTGGTGGTKLSKVALANGAVTTLSGIASSTFNNVNYFNVSSGIGLPANSAPGSITTDGSYLYIADNGTHSIVRINIATGEINTLASASATVGGMTTDGANLYFVSGNSISKLVLATGQLTAIAGGATNGIQDGVGTAASFYQPTDMTTDGTYLYVTDRNAVQSNSADAVRKVEIATGVVTTLAGSSARGFADGQWQDARFSGLGGITLLGSDLYVTDNISAIRRIVSGPAAAAITSFVTPTIPAVPTGVTAAASGTSAINLSWTASSGAVSYDVYRVATSGNTKLNATPVIGTTFQDTGLSISTNYTYAVVAVNAVGASVASASATALIVVTAPSGVSATATGTTKIDLAWASIGGATGYNVYKSTGANVPVNASTKVNASILTPALLQVTGLTSNTKYYFKVTAVYSNGESLGSTEVSATTGAYPAVATGLTATAVSGTQIDLSWNPVAGAVSYNVYLGSDTALQGNTTQTTFSVTGLRVGWYYNSFFVRAVNAAGEQSIAGPMSVSATTLSLPNPPAGVSATHVSDTQIDISWTGIAGISYNVYRSTIDYPAATITNKITTTPVTAGAYSDTVGVTAGVTYYYLITAINTVGEATNGAIASVAPVPAVPTGLSATPSGATQIDLAWTTVAGASSYNVYRSTSPSVQPIVANKVTSVSTLSFANTGLTLGTTYYYKVTAVSTGGESAATLEVSASTPSAPTTPTVAVTAVSPTQINISWNSVAGATGYNVYSSTVTGTAVGTTSLISATTPITATQFWDSGLTAGATYFYKVTAVNAAGASIASNEMSATTPAVIASAAVGTQMGGARQGSTLTLTGSVTTVAGGAAVVQSGIGKLAAFKYGLDGVTTDGANLYATESTSYKIQKIVIATGEVSTLAGSGGYNSVDGTGTGASFGYPTGITTDGVNVYVVDSFANKIRKIVIATGVVTTLAGSGSSGAADGTGSTATFDRPYGITTDGINLYVVDSYNGKIRKIDLATNVVSTLPTVTTYGLGLGITTDGTNLYFADSCQVGQVVIATGVTSTLAGANSCTSADGIGAAARFQSMRGITTDGTNLYVTDGSNPNLVRKIEIATKQVTTLTGSADGGAVGNLNFAATGGGGIVSDGTSLYVAGIKVRKIQ